ncbi:MAG: hypothetical protein V1787_05880 [Candidatus Micrarchaeota archaeon]
MRGEISLWMLTKFGMVFFIIALAAIIFSFEISAREKICDDQSQAIASAIAGRLAQVIESPAEDEQRVYPFPPGLSLGRADNVRYYVNITDHKLVSGCTGMCDGRLVIDVAPASEKSCTGSASVPYSRLFLHLTPSVDSRGVIADPYGFGEILRFSPSDIDPAKKSFYLVTIKCGYKLAPPGDERYVRHLYIQDCAHPEIGQCMQLTDDNIAGNSPVAENICGFKYET